MRLPLQRERMFIDHDAVAVRRETGGLSSYDPEPAAVHGKDAGIRFSDTGGNEPVDVVEDDPVDYERDNPENCGRDDPENRGGVVCA